jgi:hypothetical protein
MVEEKVLVPYPLMKLSALFCVTWIRVSENAWGAYASPRNADELAKHVNFCYAGWTTGIVEDDYGTMVVLTALPRGRGTPKWSLLMEDGRLYYHRKRRVAQ